MDSLYRYSNLWPVSSHFNIPSSDFMGGETLKGQFLNQEEDAVKRQITKINSLALDPILIEYIFQFALEANLSKMTSHGSIYMIEKILNNHKQIIIKDDFELLVLAVVFLNSKLYDINPISLSLLHQISGNSYSNSNVLTQESQILNALNFNIMDRESLLIDKIGMICEILKAIFDYQFYEFLAEVSFEISDIIFESQPLRYYELNKKMLLAAGIINTSFVIITKTTGVTPLVIRLALIILVTTDEIMAITDKVLKFVLGKEIYKKFTF